MTILKSSSESINCLNMKCVGILATLVLMVKTQKNYLS